MRNFLMAWVVATLLVFLSLLLNSASGEAISNYGAAFPSHSSAVRSGLSISAEDGTIHSSLPLGAVYGIGMSIPITLQYNSSYRIDPYGLGMGRLLSIPLVQTDYSYNSSDNYYELNRVTLYYQGQSYSLENKGAFSDNSCYTALDDGGDSDGPYCQLELISEPRDGDDSTLEVTQCSTDNDTECQVQYTDSSSGSTESLSWAYKIWDKNSGQATFIGFEGYGDDYDPSAGSSSENCREAGSDCAAILNEYYDYQTEDEGKIQEVYRQRGFLGTRLITNVDPVVDAAGIAVLPDGASYVTVSYAPKEILGYNLHGDSSESYQDYDAIARLMPSKITSDTGSFLSFTLDDTDSSTSDESCMEEGDYSNCNTYTVTVASSVTNYNLVLAYEEAITPVDDDPSSSNVDATAVIYPDINLVNATFSDSNTDNSYKLTYDYGETGSDYPAAPFHTEDAYLNDETETVLHPPYGSGTSILQSVSYPSGRKETVNFLISSFENRSYDYSLLELAGIPVCGSDEQNQLSESTICDQYSDDEATVFAQPYARYITVSNEDGSISIQMPQTEPNKIEGAPNVYAFPNLTGFPYVAPSFYSADPLWELQQDTTLETDQSGDAQQTGNDASEDSGYQYDLLRSNAYTGEKTYMTYLAPHMMAKMQQQEATGATITTWYSYNFKYEPGQELSSTYGAYNQPYEIKTELKNTYLYPEDDSGDYQAVETTKTIIEQDDFGNPLIVQHEDGTTTYYYYNYNNEGTSVSHYRPMIEINIPNMNDDDALLDSTSQNSTPYAFFTASTYDDTAGVILTKISGYFICTSASSCYLASGNSDGYTQATELVLDMLKGYVSSDDGFLAMILYKYDDNYRFAGTDNYPYPSASDVATATEDYDAYNVAISDLDLSVSPALTMSVAYYDSTDDLTNDGAVSTTALPLPSSGNYWYVLTTYQANSGSGWSNPNPSRIYKTLSVVNQQTNQVWGRYWGYGYNSDDDNYQSFKKMTLYQYDAFGVPTQIYSPRSDLRVLPSYTIGSGNNSSELVTQYCPYDADIGTCDSSEIQFVSRLSISADDLGRVMTRSESVSEDGSDDEWNTLAATDYQYSDSEGGMLSSLSNSYQGSSLATTVLLYDAASMNIGTLSQWTVTSDGSSDTSDSVSSYQTQEYALQLRDDIAGRYYRMVLNRCTNNTDDSDDYDSYCAQYVSIDQYERNQDSSDSNSLLYSVDGNRLVSRSVYLNENNAGEGWVFSESVLESLLDTQSSDFGESYELSTGQQNIIDLLQSLAAENITDNGWSLIYQKSYLYNRAFQPTSITEKSNYSSDGDSYNQRIFLRFYNPTTGLLYRLSSNSADNLTSAGGFSSDSSGNQDLVSVYYIYNQLNQVVTALRYAETSTNSFIEPEEDGISGNYHEKDYEWDPFGKLFAHQSCNSSDYSAGSDCQSTDNALQRFTDPSYDDLDRLTQYTDLAGNTHLITYNSINDKLASWQVENDSDTDRVSTLPICYVYATRTQLLSAVYYGETGSSPCSYSSMNEISQLSSDERLDAGLFEYQYEDNSNKLASITYPDGKSMSYTYNTDGSLATISDVADFMTSYQYYIAGGILPSQISMQSPSSSSGSTLSLELQLSYDRKNRPSSFNFTATDTPTVTTNFTYDQSVNSRTNTVEISSDEQSYTFTGERNYFSHLSSWDFTNSENSDQSYSNSYQYDALGRLVKVNDQSYTYGASNDRLDSGSDQQSYDENDELSSSSTDTYSSSGDRLSDSEGSYTYNNRGQLASFTDSDGVTYSYEYYATGLLASQSAELDDVNNKLQYYYRGTDLSNVYWYQGNSSPSEISYYFANQLARFVTDAQGNLQANEAGEDQVDYLISGLHGNVLGTFGDSELTVYDPWGVVTQSASSLLQPSDSAFDLTKIPLGYTGAYYFNKANKLYLDAREYDPTTATFTRVDPQWGNFSVRAYGRGDPTDITDPTGKHGIGYYVRKGWHDASSAVFKKAVVPVGSFIMGVETAAINASLGGSSFFTGQDVSISISKHGTSSSRTSHDIFTRKGFMHQAKLTRDEMNPVRAYKADAAELSAHPHSAWVYGSLSYAVTMEVAGVIGAFVGFYELGETVISSLESGVQSIVSMDYMGTAEDGILHQWPEGFDDSFSNSIGSEVDAERVFVSRERASAIDWGIIDSDIESEIFASESSPDDIDREEESLQTDSRNGIDTVSNAWQHFNAAINLIDYYSLISNSGDSDKTIYGSFIYSGELYSVLFKGLSFARE